MNQMGQVVWLGEKGQMGYICQSVKKNTMSQMGWQEHEGQIGVKGKVYQKGFM